MALESNNYLVTNKREDNYMTKIRVIKQSQVGEYMATLEHKPTTAQATNSVQSTVQNWTKEFKCNNSSRNARAEFAKLFAN